MKQWEISYSERYWRNSEQHPARETASVPLAPQTDQKEIIGKIRVSGLGGGQVGETESQRNVVIIW